MTKLTETIQVRGLEFWVTSNRKIGISFFSKPVDFECCSIDDFEDRMERALKSLNDRVKLRIHLFSDHTKDSDIEHSRREAFEYLGSSQNNLVFSFEMPIRGFLKTKAKFHTHLVEQSKTLLGLIPLGLLERAGLAFTNITGDSIKTLFWDQNQPLRQSDTYLDSAFERIGVIKLVKPSKNAITLETLSNLKDALPQSFEIHVSIKKIPDALARGKYAQVAKREANSNSIAGQTKAQQADSAASGIELGGDTYFNFEWHLILRRDSEAQLKTDLKIAFNELQGFADFLIESIGAFPSFRSTLPGSDFHFKGLFESLTEKDSTLVCYLPILTFGVSNTSSVAPNALAFHRRDYSMDFFDHYHPAYNNANLNIIGQSGKGKSVLINRKILADSFNQATSLIIVDVKGSHTRLVNYLAGDVFNINLKSCSGINPFNFLLEKRDEKTLETIKTFICELCLDDEEKKLNEMEGAIVEECLIEFVEKSKDYSIDGFLAYLPADFSRTPLIKRYSSKGLLRHILHSDNTQEQKSRNRIRYYNFQNIDTAANTAVSRAIMASIMADFSYTLANKSINERLIFVSDETPFFIKHCFRSFSLLSKNVRSLNGSLMLTVQVSRDLEVEGDKSLIDNAVSNIFLSGDENPETFKSRFNLSDDEARKVFTLSGDPGRYSQFLIKDPLGARIANLILTKKEYWQATTKASELGILENLKQSFNDLDEDLLIELIAKREEQKQLSGGPDA